jgi:hypothetical protein
MVHLDQEVLEKDGGWSGTMEGGRRVSAETLSRVACDCSLLAAVPPPERVVGALAWLRNWAEENDLHLGPETKMPQWDGTRPDYELAVSALLSEG